MPVRVAVQRATWDVMHHKLVTPEFVSWLERQCPGTRVQPVSDEDILDRALDPTFPTLNRIQRSIF
jgi:hypothetical protein